MNAGRASRLSRVVTGLLLAAGATVAALGIASYVADLHFQTVLSNSMQPTVSAGDVAVTQAVPFDSVEVGDVITFQPPARSEPVLHRVTSLRDGVMTTRGDANPVDDPWHLSPSGTTAYRLVAVVPAIGWVTQVQRPLLVIAGLLLGLAVLLELRKGVGSRATRSQPQSQS